MCQTLGCVILFTAILKDSLFSYFTYEAPEAQRVKGSKES